MFSYFSNINITFFPEKKEIEHSKYLKFFSLQYILKIVSSTDNFKKV